VHPRLLEAVKDDSRDPLDGMERPSARRRLSSAEVALLDFLAREDRHRRKSVAA
jgi:DNA topoisomerase I